MDAYSLSSSLLSSVSVYVKRERRENHEKNWGFRRIWFMPMEKKEVITLELAKRFFAEVEKHQENEGRAGMGGSEGIRF